MYATLPLTTPLCVLWLCPAALAMPKSTTFTAPWRDSRMLSGLMSRWTRPRGSPVSASVKSWAKASPSQARETIRAHSGGGQRQRAWSVARLMSVRRFGPSMYSIARK